eukprot:1195096-Alexandrium_andersonii.AAC.1
MRMRSCSLKARSSSAVLSIPKSRPWKGMVTVQNLLAHVGRGMGHATAGMTTWRPAASPREQSAMEPARPVITGP